MRNWLWAKGGKIESNAFFDLLSRDIQTLDALRLEFFNLLFAANKKIHFRRYCEVIKKFEREKVAVAKKNDFLSRPKKLSKLIFLLLYFLIIPAYTEPLIEWKFSLDNFVCVTLIAHFRFSFASSRSQAHTHTHRCPVKERAVDIIDSPTSRERFIYFYFCALIWKWKQGDFYGVSRVWPWNFEFVMRHLGIFNFERYAGFFWLRNCWL